MQYHKWIRRAYSVTIGQRMSHCIYFESVGWVFDSPRAHLIARCCHCFLASVDSRRFGRKGHGVGSPITTSWGYTTQLLWVDESAAKILEDNEIVSDGRRRGVPSIPTTWPLCSPSCRRQSRASPPPRARPRRCARALALTLATTRTAPHRDCPQPRQRNRRASIR